MDAIEVFDEVPDPPSEELSVSVLAEASVLLDASEPCLARPLVGFSLFPALCIAADVRAKIVDTDSLLVRSTDTGREPGCSRAVDEESSCESNSASRVTSCPTNKSVHSSCTVFNTGI